MFQVAPPMLAAVSARRSACIGAIRFAIAPYLTTTSSLSITIWFQNLVVIHACRRSTRCHLRRARRSDPAGDPCAAGARRSVGDRARRALRHEPAGDLQASQGPRARRTGHAGRDAQRRPCRLEAEPLAEATAWLERYRQAWEANFRRLDNLLDELKHERQTPGDPREATVTFGSRPPKKAEGPCRVAAQMIVLWSTTVEQGVRHDLDHAHREHGRVAGHNAGRPRDRHDPHLRRQRELVFEAWTRPALVRRWLLGPSGWSMPVCEIDLRIGGRYQFVWRRDPTARDGHGWRLS